MSINLKSDPKAKADSLLKGVCKKYPGLDKRKLGTSKYEELRKLYIDLHKVVHFQAKTPFLRINVHGVKHPIHCIGKQLHYVVDKAGQVNQVSREVAPPNIEKAYKGAFHLYTPKVKNNLNLAQNLIQIKNIHSKSVNFIFGYKSYIKK